LSCEGVAGSESSTTQRSATRQFKSFQAFLADFASLRLCERCIRACYDRN
jgi:hypothetical protein